MAAAIRWTDRARDDLRRVPAEQVKRVRAALGRLARDRVGDVSKLSGPDPEWRLRVDDYRVRFTYTTTDEMETILVLRVLPRQSAYRD